MIVHKVLVIYVLQITQMLGNPEELILWSLVFGQESVPESQWTGQDLMCLLGEVIWWLKS